MALYLRWSFNNQKLAKLKTVSFGIPAFRARDDFVTCPGAAACSLTCFAKHGWYTLPRTIGPREFNLLAIRSDLGLFEQFLLHDLRRIRKMNVRIHDSGDFFSQKYLDAWFRVARRVPKQFYAYTKSLQLNWSRKPPNFIVVQSEGGKFDRLLDPSRPQARVFLTHEEREAAGYVDGSESDMPVLTGATRIGLIYHGPLQPVGVLMENIR